MYIVDRFNNQVIQTVKVQTCVGPKVISHGGCCEEGIVAGQPRALEWLLAHVQLLVIRQGPLLCESPVTDFAHKFPVVQNKKNGV